MQPDDPMGRADDLSHLIDGPFIITFTAHLPFAVGIPNELGHILYLGTSFRDDSVTADFGSMPFVRIRVFEVVESGMPMRRKGTYDAIEKFYGVRLESVEGAEDTRYGEGEIFQHDQWVTLETPYAALANEDEAADPAFTFHRCLNIFNVFLQASLLITRDINLRSISSHDLRPVVIVGAIPKDGTWQYMMPMLMHPEARSDGSLPTEQPFGQDELNSALAAMINNKPYMSTAIWRSRAQRSLTHTGDATDAVISFQIAAESLLFDTYRMLLVDEGSSSVEIQTKLGGEIPFKSLVARILPAKLGGNWDITREGTPVGDYWKKLYLVRNAIIHRGMRPHVGHAEGAQAAYWGLRDHVEARLWHKRNLYPRTLFVRVGETQLEERGWLPATMRRLVEQFKAEPKPFYWPHDLAGREPEGDKA